ncbi:hypothetical protein [Aquabacterium sp.]|uniref:hypothetical protein n=1 Tax=Aquabacterium sp. TaxID=1872578 RepID=UPI00403797B7
MTPYDLKRKVIDAGHCAVFFSRERMSLRGDVMKNFGVTAQPVTVKSSSGETHTCWELYRRYPTRQGLKDPVYFDTSTFVRIYLPKADTAC